MGIVFCGLVGFYFAFLFSLPFFPWWDSFVYHCIHVGPFGCSFDEYICFHSSKKKKNPFSFQKDVPKPMALGYFLANGMACSV